MKLSQTFPPLSNNVNYENPLTQTISRVSLTQLTFLVFAWFSCLSLAVTTSRPL